MKPRACQVLFTPPLFYNLISIYRNQYWYNRRIYESNNCISNWRYRFSNKCSGTTFFNGNIFWNGQPYDVSFSLNCGPVYGRDLLNSCVTVLENTRSCRTRNSIIWAAIRYFSWIVVFGYWIAHCDRTSIRGHCLRQYNSDCHNWYSVLCIQQEIWLNVSPNTLNWVLFE